MPRYPPFNTSDAAISEPLADRVPRTYTGLPASKSFKANEVDSVIRRASGEAVRSFTEDGSETRTGVSPAEEGNGLTTKVRPLTSIDASVPYRLFLLPCDQELALCTVHIGAKHDRHSRCCIRIGVDAYEISGVQVGWAYRRNASPRGYRQFGYRRRGRQVDVLQVSIGALNEQRTAYRVDAKDRAGRFTTGRIVSLGGRTKHDQSHRI